MIPEERWLNCSSSENYKFVQPGRAGYIIFYTCHPNVLTYHGITRWNFDEYGSQIFGYTQILLKTLWCECRQSLERFIEW